MLDVCALTDTDLCVVRREEAYTRLNRVAVVRGAVRRADASHVGVFPPHSTTRTVNAYAHTHTHRCTGRNVQRGCTFLYRVESGAALSSSLATRTVPDVRTTTQTRFRSFSLAQTPRTNKP